MNVLPYVFPDFLLNEQFDSFVHPSEICVHKDFERRCFKNRDPDKEPPPPPVPYHHRMPIWMKQYYFGLSVLMLNLMLWLYFSRMRKMRSRRETPFFTMLCILSLTASFRISFSIITISISAYLWNPESSTKNCLLQSSLYIDYWCNFFSLTITFWMSLNRCLLFVAKDLNSKIFDGIRVAIPIMFSVLVAIFGMINSILTSEVHRNFLDKWGIVDTGPNKGYRVMINRTFFLLPVASIVCYIILYIHLRQRAKEAFAKSNNQCQGEEKVFGQLFVTTILYVTFYLTYEALALMKWYDDYPFQITFISFFGIFNCLPEMSLPLLMICSNLPIKKKLRAWCSLKSTTHNSVVNKAPMQLFTVTATGN